MASVASGNETLNKASSIWKFLDQMSLANPGEYKKFVNQVVNEGKKENMGPPVPMMSIKTTKLPKVIPHRDYYINIAEWSQVPSPKSKVDPVPILATEIREETINQEISMIIDVVMNPNVFENIDSMVNQKENLTSAPLIEMVLQYVESRNKIKLSRKYNVTEIKYMGNQDNLLNFICPTSLKDSISNVNKKESGNVLLDKVKKSGIENKKDKSVGNEKDFESKNLISDSNSISLTATNNSNGITEIKSKKIKKKDIKATSCLEKPKVEMLLHQKNIEFNIYLPNVQSVKECDLNLTEISLDLIVKEKYELHLTLPLAIDVDNSNAKFLKDEEILNVKSTLT